MNYIRKFWLNQLFRRVFQFCIPNRNDFKFPNPVDWVINNWSNSLSRFLRRSIIFRWERRGDFSSFNKLFFEIKFPAISNSSSCFKVEEFIMDWKPSSPIEIPETLKTFRFLKFAEFAIDWIPFSSIEFPFKLNSFKFFRLGDWDKANIPIDDTPVFSKFNTLRFDKDFDSLKKNSLISNKIVYQIQAFYIFNKRCSGQLIQSLMVEKIIPQW